MNIAAFKTVALRGFHTGVFLGKKYAPEILTGVGVTGVVVGTVMVAKASLKLEPVVDKMTAATAAVKEFKAAGEFETERDYHLALLSVYTRGVVDLTKLYGPSVGVVVFSIASILAAHGIMRRRNVALVAAYKVVESAFGNYRERVVEELGAEKDYEFYHGVTTEKVKSKDADGKTVTEEVKVVDPNKLSGYAVWFDEGNPNYEKNAEYNRQFLQGQQKYFNDRLHAYGYVFLNDVREALGFEKTTAGSIVGWVVSKEGDNNVDFGIFNENNAAARRFINGEERSIILDFNVDGVIYDKIDDIVARMKR